MFVFPVEARLASLEARCHCDRDRDRGNAEATCAGYKRAIHEAVLRSQGLDEYTGEALHWHLVGTYRNKDSRAQGRRLKAKLSRLPTVDHVGDGRGETTFRICGWAVNDAKNDLSLDDFVALCERVLWHQRGGLQP